MDLPPIEAFNIRPMSLQTYESLVLEELNGKVPSDARKAHFVLHVRDKGVCGICGTSVDISLRHPHPGSASMDHIIHRSNRGSTHEWANLRLAHRQCNLERNASEVAPEIALERLHRAVRRFTHPEIYLPMDVEKATIYFEASERELDRYKESLALQQATAERRASVGKEPTWRLASAVDDLERAEDHVSRCAQRLRVLLGDLVVQYAAATLAACVATDRELPDVTRDSPAPARSGHTGAGDS
ncbi:HNH endonuclease [Arthrobacter sp. 92]|uniref:HNH endonuclease n=1 Tax=Arthrobacter sp. 92 TaxID=3418175 RepID=UPI003D0573C7